MNRQFYEFWASFFTNAAQGQKQFEDVSALLKQGVERDPFAREDRVPGMIKKSAVQINHPGFHPGGDPGGPGKSGGQNRMLVAVPGPVGKRGQRVRD